MTAHEREPARLTPQLMIGLLIVAVGVLFTLNNAGVLEARQYLRFWPAGLIAVGLVSLWQAVRTGTPSIGGLVLMAGGTWLLLERLNVVRVRLWEMWPLILVVVGLLLVWQGLTRRGRPPSADASDTVNAIAILSGVSRGNNSRRFRGGDLTAFMGGVELDLRQAVIAEEAVLDVFAMWGGIEIRVPEDWAVEGRVTPLLGGFEDKSRPAPGAATRRLVVQGWVIMGGVEVKN